MAEVFAARRRPSEGEGIDDWMAARWDEIESRPSAELSGRETWHDGTRFGLDIAAARPGDLVVLGRLNGSRRLTGQESASVALEAEDAGPGGPSAAPAEPALKLVAARPGDSISRLVGSSDPRTIGKFLALNGLSGRNSTIRAGRSYIVPTSWDDVSDAEHQAGRTVLGADNARLRAREEADRAADRAAEDLLQGRNIWTGEIPGPMRSQPRSTRRPDSMAARALAGTLGFGVGLFPGVGRGAAHMIEGGLDTAVFATRAMNPGLDLTLSGSGRTVGEEVLDGAGRIVGYGNRVRENPAKLGNDVHDYVHRFRLDHDPTATPVADTAREEFERGLNLGLNDGELAFHLGSLAVGEEALRLAAGIGPLAKGAGVTEGALLAQRPGQAAYFAEDYKPGMSHHIWARKKRLPAWLGGGLLPAELLESPFNKIRQVNITRRDQFRNHKGAGGHLDGGKIPVGHGGGSWPAADLGWEPYSFVDRLRDGTAPETHALVGTGLTFGTTIDLAKHGADQ